MSFEIGTRVVSRFCGEGTVMSDVQPSDPGQPKRQTVQFDNTLIGTREYEIGKLDRTGDDDGS